MAEVVGRPPLTVTAHYLSPGLVGPTPSPFEVIKIGRMIATATASMVSESTGREVLRLLGAFGVGDPSAPRSSPDAPPWLPSSRVAWWTEARPDQPMPRSSIGSPMRLDPACTGFREGRPTGTAEMRGWFAFADGSEIDVFSLLLAVDAFPRRCSTPISGALGADGGVDRAHPRHPRTPGRLPACSGRGSSPTGCSRRTAKCGTPPVDSSPSRVS